MTTPTQAQIEACINNIIADIENGWEGAAIINALRDLAALTAAAEVRPADISCPFCGGENGQHDHNCGLKKTAAAAEVKMTKPTQAEQKTQDAILATLMSIENLQRQILDAVKTQS